MNLNQVTHLNSEIFGIWRLSALPWYGMLCEDQVKRLFQDYSVSIPSGQALLTMKMIVGDALRDDLRDDNLKILCGVLRDEVFDGLLNVDLTILLW